MNCCDDFGRCTCSAGVDSTGGMQTGIRFAPGVVEGYKAPFFGTPAQRRELARWAKRAVLWTALAMVAAFCAGLISGGFR